ncbi:hypothetical protein QUB70_00710 [Microcoleus sp. A003_D6]
MPIPQELFFLLGWASCPSHQLMKRIFARGLIVFCKINSVQIATSKSSNDQTLIFK